MKIRWREEEDDILRELWANSNISMNDIVKVLTIRTKDAVEQRAIRLNLGRKATHGLRIDFEYLKKLQEVVEG